MAESFIRRENLNALCVRLGWVSRRAKHLGAPSELIRWIGRSFSFWSGIDPFGDADLWGVGGGFAADAVVGLKTASDLSGATAGHRRRRILHWSCICANEASQLWLRPHLRLRFANRRRRSPVSESSKMRHLASTAVA